MNDLISREAVLAICQKEYEERLRMADYCGDTVAWNIGGEIKALPAVDAAPVVRCGECKWFGTSQTGGGWCNEGMARPMPYDGFCSYGERRDENGAEDIAPMIHGG